MKASKLYLLLLAAIAASTLPLWDIWARLGKNPTNPMWERSLEPLKPREVSRGPRGQRQIALTFDAGYEATDLSLLLGLLDREQVKATFFVTGKWVLRYPEQARWLATRNEVVGNHSWAHPEYTHLSDDAIREDLLTADRLLFKHFGHSVKPLFRLPFGDRDDRVLRILAENGYVSIYWSLDTLDSMEPRKSASFIIDRVTNRSDEELDGAIVLSHVGYPETCAAMPAIIGNLRARGFHFVTLLDWLQFNKAVKVP